MDSNIWKYIESMCKSSGYWIAYEGKDKDDIKSLPGKIVVGYAGAYKDNGEALVDAATKYIKRIFIDRTSYVKDGLQRVNDVADNDTVIKYWVEAAIGFAQAMDSAETILSERKKYHLELPAADYILKVRCAEKAAALYGDPIPAPILDRMTAELSAIRVNKHATHYLIASELVKYSAEKGYPVSTRGMLSSSLVSFLSGISEVNPLSAHYSCPKCHHFEFAEDENCGLDLPDRSCPECGSAMTGDGVDIYPEVNMGLNLDREPDIILNFAPEIRHEIIEYIRAEFSKEQVFRAGVKVDRPDGTIRKNVHPGGIFIVPSNADISSITALREHEPDDEFMLDDGLLITEEDYHNIDDKLKKYDILTQSELGMLHDLEHETGFRYKDIRFNDESVLAAFSDMDNSYMQQFGDVYRQAVKVVKPHCFSDLARIEGLMHGAGTWTENGEVLIKEGIALADIISCRDDVMQYLMSKGISKADSYTSMQRVRGGKGLTQELAEQIRATGIPEWYIESCNKIQYVYPWAQCVEYTRVNWMLAYYWVHYPEDYQKIYEKHFTV